MKTWIITNPSAGSAQQLDELREFLDSLEPAAIHTTSGPGDAEKFARQAVNEGCDQIVVVGGDGTLNEVVNGVAECAENCAVGLLPLGTGNDFARSLSLPETFAECVEIVRAGKRAPVDVVRVHCDHVCYFVNVSAGGFSGLVNEILTPEMKRSWGPLAYLRCAAEAYANLCAFTTTILLDDVQPISGEFYNVVVANGRYVAGGIPIAPEAQINDGLLDVVVIPKLATPAMAIAAAQIAVGKHLENDDVIFRRAARVRVESTPGMWFNVDGELVSNEPMTFEVMPAALQFIVP